MQPGLELEPVPPLTPPLNTVFTPDLLFPGGLGYWVGDKKQKELDPVTLQKHREEKEVFFSPFMFS